MTIQEIVNQLEAWSEAYYTGNEQVDDTAFDALEDELRARDPHNPYFLKNREKPFAYGQKVNHIYEFIGSIDKIHSLQESKLITGEPIDLSAKLDGSSLVTYFKNGGLVAVTRGNGYTGVDVTQHYYAITKKYSVQVPDNFTGAIRGEIVFRKSNWEKFKQLHPEAKAARNSATGLLNQKEVQPEEALLDYVIYDVVATNQPNFDGNYWKQLESFNIPVAPHFSIVSSVLTDEMFSEVYEDWSTEFPCDGIVMRKHVYQALEGVSGIYTYPKVQEAYKFQAEVKLCDVNSIEWQLGRTGKLTPVLKIDPVEMSGAVVTSITAHNVENVKKLQLGKGAKILAYRSGEVIPTVKECIVPGNVVIPTHCPYCGSKLEYTSSGKDLVCTYEECEGKQKFRIFNFIEQMCSEVKGLGGAFLEAFVKELANDIMGSEVTNLRELYIACKRHKGNPFITLGNADNKIAAKVIDIITSNTIDVEKFFLGLGIKLLGTEAAKKLAKQPQLTSNILLTFHNGNRIAIKSAIIAALPGQVALADNVYYLFSEVHNLLDIIDFDNINFVYKEEKQTQYYAITGSLSKPRKELQAEFSLYGWEMTDNLNKAKVLITDDPTSNSSKIMKARELNKKIISEADFRVEYL